MPRNPNEAPVSSDALPTEAQLRATDEEFEAAPPDESSEEDRLTRIRAAAYAAFLRRGEAPGDEVQDWLDAEREVGAGDSERRASD